MAGFSLAAPGTPRPPHARATLAPLKPSRRPWYRVTADSEWSYTREEDATTSWTVAHLPEKTVVATCLSSLTECRAYTASGEAQEDLERIRACRRGEHDTRLDPRCRDCTDGT